MRQALIATACNAPRLLGESTALVREFVLRKQHPDGGFQNRAGQSDLYYTVFGLQSLLALQLPLPAQLSSYLASFEDGQNLDFVHLCCLARCRAILGDARGNKSLAGRIEAHRSGDGGYHPVCGSPHGTAYAAFLALGAYQDMQIRLPDSARLKNAIRLLATPEGAWSNERAAKLASTNSTAAAMAVLGGSATRVAGRWLLAQAHTLGGFRASPLAPIPDLLSTATALHAVATLGLPIAGVREPCLDFIDTLWSNEGGFHGQWQDDCVDVEYTFYGLLALGHLAR